MKRVTSAKRTVTMILLAGLCLVGMSGTAGAWWGCHRGWGGGWGWGHHHRFAHYPVWPTYYRSYGFHHRWHYPVYRTYYPTCYRSYYPTYYYTTPYVSYGCFGSVNRVSPFIANHAVQPGNQWSPVVDTYVAATQQPASSTFDVADRARRGKIELTVNVPEDARITINEEPTKTTGSQRTYLSRDVSLEDRYEFLVRAEIQRGGRTISETKRVFLNGGQSSSLDFTLVDQSGQLASDDDGPVTTALTVHVPEDATVYLAGVQTKQTGSVRVFETSHLRAGQQLKDYAVRVVLPGDGLAQTREKSLTLVGGQAQEIEFDFTIPGDRLAAK